MTSRPSHNTPTSTIAEDTRRCVAAHMMAAADSIARRLTTHENVIDEPTMLRCGTFVHSAGGTAEIIQDCVPRLAELWCGDNEHGRRPTG